MREVAISEFKAKCIAVLDQVQQTKMPVRAVREARGRGYSSVARSGSRRLDRFHEGQDENPRRYCLSATDEKVWEVFRDRSSFSTSHIWLWSLKDPGKLGKRVLNELRNPANELWLSPISTWEALALNAKSRIQLPKDKPFGRSGDSSAAGSASDSTKSRLRHNRVATVKVLDLTLITGDANLLGLGDISTLANR
jgi:hypothetical protein